MKDVSRWATAEPHVLLCSQSNSTRSSTERESGNWDCHKFFWRILDNHSIWQRRVWRFPGDPVWRFLREPSRPSPNWPRGGMDILSKNRVARRKEQKREESRLGVQSFVSQLNLDDKIYAIVLAMRWRFFRLPNYFLFYISFYLAQKIEY